MSYYDAKRCFSENIGLCGGTTNAEKYNLYNGFLNLVDNLMTDITEIKQRLCAIENNTQRR